MNRNTCCTQNMGSHGGRNNMTQTRCAMPMKEPMRPCMENNARSGQNNARTGRMDMGVGAERNSMPCTCEDDWKQEVPVGNRKKLLCYIDEVSFGMYDALLYLDTHPNDEVAIRYFHQHNRKRNFALKEYAKAYGPLNLGMIDDEAGSSWEWTCQPWPWEGGNY